MKNRNLVIVILAIICAGLLAGVVYTVTKGKSGTQKKQEASAEAGADETESQSGIIEEDGKKYKLNPDIKTVLFMGVDKEEKAGGISRSRCRRSRITVRNYRRRRKEI